jgi:hypothetical protein
MSEDEELLKTRILEAIRRFNGELDWRGLAIASGVDPCPSDALLAFHAAITSLQHAQAFRLEFDARGMVRFWLDSGAESRPVGDRDE